MKRYWLFAGDTYYPSGGMGDFRGDFDTQEDALQEVSDVTDWYHIFDTAERRIVDPPGMDTDMMNRRIMKATTP